MAGKNKSGLTPAVIESLRAKGLSQSDIAREYNVSRSYVSWIKSQYGGVTPTPREMAKEVWPFQVESRFHGAAVNARLREHVEYQITDGEGMGRRKLQLLAGFYRRLIDENLVVEFDPSIPPSEGIYTGGWAFRPRVESDGDLVIRVNEFTKELDEEARIVWRMPTRIPDE